MKKYKFYSTVSLLLAVVMLGGCTLEAQPEKEISQGGRVATDVTMDSGVSVDAELVDSSGNTIIYTNDESYTSTDGAIGSIGVVSSTPETASENTWSPFFLDTDGTLWTKSLAYDSTTDSQKVSEISPVNEELENGVIDVDTTNVAAAAQYYPSATGFTMDGKKNFSLTGKFIDAHAVSSTLSVQGTNDEDTTNADWINVQGQINGLASATTAIPIIEGTVSGVTSVTLVTGTVCNLIETVTAQTVKFTWDFDNINYRHVRVVLTPGDATNTVILKGRINY